MATKIVVNCETGEVQELELTADEIAEREASAAEFAEQEAQRKAEADAKEALRQSAITKLVAGQPLTEEEAALLVIG